MRFLLSGRVSVHVPYPPCGPGSAPRLKTQAAVPGGPVVPTISARRAGECAAQLRIERAEPVALAGTLSRAEQRCQREHQVCQPRPGSYCLPAAGIVVWPFVARRAAVWGIALLILRRWASTVAISATVITRASAGKHADGYADVCGDPVKQIEIGGDADWSIRRSSSNAPDSLYSSARAQTFA